MMKSTVRWCMGLVLRLVPLLLAPTSPLRTPLVESVAAIKWAPRGSNPHWREREVRTTIAAAIKRTAMRWLLTGLIVLLVAAAVVPVAVILLDAPTSPPPM